MPVGHRGAGARGERCAPLVGVGCDRGRQQRHGDRGGSRELHHGAVEVVAGFEQHHLVAGLQQGQQRGCDALGGAGAHEHLRVRIQVQTVVRGLVRGDGPTERGDPDDGGVLVVTGLQGGRRGVEHLLRRVEVREALAQVD